MTLYLVYTPLDEMLPSPYCFTTTTSTKSRGAMIPMAAEGVTVRQMEVPWVGDKRMFSTYNSVKLLDKVTTDKKQKHCNKNTTHLCNLFQKLKSFHIAVPFDSKPVRYGLQALPHFQQAAADDPIPLVTGSRVDDRTGSGEEMIQAWLLPIRFKHEA